MSALYLMLPFALLLGAVFLIGFLKMVSDGQYDDLETPAHRILLEDEVKK
jgi:cbb3-type cytochrome oxidase maturation protein